MTVDSHGDSPSDRSRVAIVTGAGRGIGRATALVLVQAGIQVMAVSRSQSELASLAERGTRRLPSGDRCNCRGLQANY